MAMAPAPASYTNPTRQRGYRTRDTLAGASGLCPAREKLFFYLTSESAMTVLISRRRSSALSDSESMPRGEAHDGLSIKPCQ